MTDTRDKIIEQLRDQIAFLTSPQMQIHTETMRDRFAMAALNGIMSRNRYSNDEVNFKFFAEHAYNVADEMMEARLKGIK